jgi:ribosome-associated protein
VGDDELRIAPGVAIPLSELEWRFSAAGGPGGQHVNTANTRAEVRFDIRASKGLSSETRDRLVARLGPVTRVVAGERRSQARNRDVALQRLAARLGRALEEHESRRPTRPTPASVRRRLEAKARRAAVKRDRRRPGDDG